ncbi:MAG: hypothetical protein J2P21_07625 [Chloracidobacterium sp.]|nr:hypothetical protein [Chloracidobacterium sp.]
MAWVAQVVLGMILSFVSGFGLYILHLGRLFNNRPISDFESHVETTGTLATPVIEEVVGVVAEPQMGRVRIDPRKGEVETHSKTKRRDHGLGQAAPESSSATSSHMNP